MKYFFLFFALFTCVNISIAQERIEGGISPCSYDAIHQKKMQTDANYRKESEDFEKLVTDIRNKKNKAILESGNARVTTDVIYKIPIVVHVLHRGEPIGQGINVSDEHIQEIIKQANQDYRKIVNTTGYGNGFDTNVEFALAVRDVNGNSTNGIDRIDMSGNTSYMALGLNSGFSLDNLVAQNTYRYDKYMNIWIVSGSDGGNWVAFGGGGLVCVSAYVFSLHSVVAHELGHEMSLAHTFQGETTNSDGTFGCPPLETDPYVEGDHCPDTPRHTEFSQTCGATVHNPCYPAEDVNQVDDLYETNYMAYGRCGGGNNHMFSNDQRSRIRAKAVLRSNYYLYNQLVPLSSVAVNFTANNVAACSATTPVTFYDKSAGVPNTYLAETEWPNIQFAWTFTNGTTTYNSTKQNPVMTFSAPGYYNVTLTITTPFGSSTQTKDQFVYVEEQTITSVCSSDFSYGAYYQTLNSVKFNTIFKETRVDFPDSYLDLRYTNNTIVIEGQTYPLTINIRGSSSAPEKVKAFIDYNDNGLFEDSELIFQGTSTVDFQYFNSNVTIPLNAVKNRLLTMRVVGYTDNFTGGCGTLLNSDTEDYGIVIKGNCTADLVEFSAAKIISCQGSTIQFHDKSCVSNQAFINSITYNWTFSNGTTTYSSIKQHPSITFLQLGVYNVSLSITTPSGTQTLTKENFIKITEPATSVCNTFTGSVNYWLYRSISKVVFNSINKQTSTRTNEGYKDFRCTDNTVVKEGVTYPLSINIGTSGGDTARYKVYIDYNNSGTFEESEVVFAGTSTSSAVVTLTQNITIPYSAIKNRMVTMRIMAAVGDIASGCSNISVPDVEDYGIMIVSNCVAETIDFAAERIVGCLNTSIKFLDSSCIPYGTNFNNYSYQWTISNGTTTYNSSEQNPSITFGQIGVYSVTLNIATSSGVKTITKQNYIRIGEAPATVCIISQSSGTWSNRAISKVVLNTINRDTPSNINEVYKDFRCTDNTVVKEGVAYPLSINIGTSGGDTATYKVYIDYNDSGTFEVSELIFSGTSNSSAVVTLTQNITIPFSSIKNRILTMRVMTAVQDFSSACSTLTVPDVEDYGVMVVSNCISETLDFDSDKILGCPNTVIKFYDKSCIPYSTNFNNYSYQWTFTNGTTTYSSTEQNPSITFGQNGIYSVTLNITTPSGIRTITKQDYVRIVISPISVCTTITSSDNAGSRNINHVIFNTIDKRTSTSINEGYQDFRCTNNTTVKDGQTYVLSISTNSTSTYYLERYKVYIDYNNDATFATSELVFEGIATLPYTIETFTHNVTIPHFAVKNTFLTMRVVGDRQTISSTCGSFANPDIEDYGIMVVDCTDVTPIFTQVEPVCYGTAMAALPTTSNNSIIGSWLPALNNMATTTYTFTPSAGSCSSTTMTITVGTTTTWNGTTWSDGTPISTSKAIISGNYSGNTNLTACSLEVTGTAIVTVPSGYNFNISGPVTVASSASLTFENNANLLQQGTTNSNTGTVTVKRESAPIVRLDHTFWSSPVTGSQTLLQFSPNTLPNRFYDYSTASNVFTTIPTATTFVAGKGYAIRASNSQYTPLSSPFLGNTWLGTFVGTPNSGTINLPLSTTGTGYNLVGNPYPSPIDAVSLLSANPNIGSTFYFYQHTLTMLASGLFPSGSNYGTWVSGTGGTKATDGNGHSPSNYPSGIIQVGQGFIIKSTGSSSLVFNNNMRVGDNNALFLRTTPTEKHRLWLNLKTDTGTDINQILVGYIEGATQNADANFDGLSFGGDGSYLTSKIDGNGFTIQGRELPFNSNDVVPLAFKSIAAGNYVIELTKKDGLFEGNQDVFIRDNLMGIDHNLKIAPYTFASVIGTFDNRFELVYTQALGIPSSSFTQNAVIVYKNTDWFHVNTKGIVIKDIHVYDICGRLIFKQTNINATKSVLNELASVDSVLFLRITSDNNEIVTVKVINESK